MPSETNKHRAAAKKYVRFIYFPFVTTAVIINRVRATFQKKAKGNGQTRRAQSMPLNTAGAELVHISAKIRKGAQAGGRVLLALRQRHGELIPAHHRLVTEQFA
jgi:hypothetical protein